MKNSIVKTIDLFLHMAVFATLFMLVGKYVPETYYRYFDTTQYYYVKVPAPVDGARFKACDLVPVIISRKSLINTTADVDISLVLEYKNTKERVSMEKKNIVISIGEDTYIARYKVPCTVQPGTYIFDALVHYRVYDLDKYTRVYTDPFEVVGDLQTEEK